jgi:L-lactate dehydrogenase complex protein LldG
MSEARDRILGSIRTSLKRGPLGGERLAAVEDRLAAHRRNLVPARARVSAEEGIELFVRMATEVAATVERVAGLQDVPDAVAAYLARHNLPAELRVAPDPELDSVPWERRPTLTVAHGRAEDRDAISVTGAVAGVAETGTLVMASGPAHPTTLNLMPDTHIVVLRADRIVGSYEDAWDVLRARGALPRTVNLITGPSRTGDIEQTIQLGAHGPRRLHILLVDGVGEDGASA